MNNRFIANTVNAAVQNLLHHFDTLGNSFNDYSQADFFSKKKQTVRKAHNRYHQSKEASEFLFGFRSFCQKENYNEYETGRYLYNLCATSDFKGIAANPAECTALAIYIALKGRNLDQINRALVIDKGALIRKKVLHQFVIIGEVAGDNTSAEFPLCDVGNYLKNNLLPQSEPPWALDAAFNLACSLEQYPEKLGTAISLCTEVDSVFEKIRPPIAEVLGWTKDQTRILGSERAARVESLYQVGPEIPPMAFYNLVFGGNLLTQIVTPQSTRVNLSKNDGTLNSNDLF